MSRHPARGVSIIEVLIVMVLLAIFASMAGPGMADFVDKRRLVAKTGQITDLLQTARSEAIKHSSVTSDRSISVTLSPGSGWFVGAATTACTTAAACKITEAGVDITRVVDAADCPGCALSAPAAQTTITYDMRGLVSAGSDASLTLESPRGGRVTVSVSRIGRISTCSPSGSVSDFPTC